MACDVCGQEGARLRRVTRRPYICAQGRCEER
jgi:hypothetical protein